MGRSVSYPSGALVAFQGLEIDDEDDWEFTLEWLRDDLIAQARRAFPSLEPHDGWRGREDRILLRNGYADFGLSIYGGLAAVWIVERDDTSYHEAELRRPLHALAQHWLGSVAGRFDDLFGEYVCLGHMSNGEGVYRKRH